MIYTISHNGETQTTPNLPEGYSVDDIKGQCIGRWPELANATMNVGTPVTNALGFQSASITFQLAQGNKA